MMWPVSAREIELAIRQRLPACAADLHARFSDALAAIARRWPDAPHTVTGYAAHVADRLARQSDPDAALARLHPEELFLAWWAGTGAAAGLTAFDAELGGEIARLAARFPQFPSDELIQMLRVKLFVGATPKIFEYSGFGSLLAWIRVVAVRSFVDAARAARSHQYHEELDEAELLGVPAAGERQIGSVLAAAVKHAFADAVARLAPRQRAFLRHAYVDRLTLDQIAASYAIHRATVARTLASARAQLIEQTRTGVSATLGVTPSELASAIGTLDRRLDLSLSRILRTP
jgi:RNA polymerase sigma-70 factor (ECF subfamily)